MKINLRKDRMNAWERWAALLSRKPLDRVPVFGFHMGGFSSVYTGLSIADSYNNPQKAFESMDRVNKEFGWQDMPMIGYAAMGAWEFGGDIKWPSGEYAGAPMVTRKPVQSYEDVDNIKAPDVKKAGIIPLVMEVSKLCAAAGHPLIMTTTLSPWSLCGNIAGIDTMCKWSLKKPDVVHKFLEKAYPFSVDIIRYWVETFGAQRLLPWVGGSAAATNDLISPKQFEEFNLPYLKRLYAEVHKMGVKHIFIHICGEQNLNLPHWAQLDYGDPGVLTFGHEVDIETAARYFPKHVIVGNVEPAMIQEGTQEQVYELSRKCIEKGRKCPGGFMLAPGCGLPPRAPVDNIRAMMQAVSDHGWYE